MPSPLCRSKLATRSDVPNPVRNSKLYQSKKTRHSKLEQILTRAVYAPQDRSCTDQSSPSPLAKQIPGILTSVRASRPSMRAVVSDLCVPYICWRTLAAHSGDERRGRTEFGRSHLHPQHRVRSEVAFPLYTRHPKTNRLKKEQYLHK